MTPDTAQLDARITELEEKLGELDEAFYAQGDPGTPGGEGAEGPGGEVGADGTTTETYQGQVEPNGTVESPLSESKLERKGVITKKNLKTEGEKEGFGGSKIGQWKEPEGHKISQVGVGTKSTEFTPNAAKDVMLVIRLEVAKGTVTVQAEVDEEPAGKLTIASITIKSLTGENSGRQVIIVPKGKKVKLETHVFVGAEGFGEIEVTGELPLD